MRDLEEHLHQYLLKPGQTVYIQGARIHGRRNSKVELVSYSEDKAIDFFTNCHGKVIDSSDFRALLDEKEKLGQKTFISNGQMGIVVSSFHWAHTKEEIQELLESKKIEKEEEATASLMSLVLVGDTLILASEKYLNAVEL